MRCFRLVQQHRAAQALSGEGARRYGGRWNPKGISMCYAASSLALSILELRVHLREPPLHVYLALVLDVADNAVDVLSTGSLPAHWRTLPAPDELKALGKDWVQKQRSVALAVPSAIIPQEQNLLLNPTHPDFSSSVRIADRIAIQFDQRLF